MQAGVGVRFLSYVFILLRFESHDPLFSMYLGIFANKDTHFNTAETQGMRWKEDLKKW